MSKVAIVYRGGLADTVGKTEEIIQADTVADVLKHIKVCYGKEAMKTARSMVIAVNEIGILQMRVFKTKLNDGDKVQFLPIAGGG